MTYISEDLRARIIRLQGTSTGNATADEMEATAQFCFESWNLKLDGPPFESEYGYVQPVITDCGENAVFKVHQVFELEHAVPLLRHWSGRGGANLLNSTEDERGILIQRADPGTTAGDQWTKANDEQLTTAAALMLKSLHSAPVVPEIIQREKMLTADGRGKAFARYRARHAGGGPLPAHLVEAGERIHEELSSGDTILHGDFHHFNMLLHGDTWLIIDPQGVIGPPEMDAGPWITNPWPNWVPEISREILDSRLRIFEEVLGWDSELVKAWTLARASICAVWSDEDKEEIDFSIKIFERIWSAWK